MVNLESITKKTIIPFIIGFTVCFFLLFTLTYWGMPFDQVIHRWQTLIAGLLALMGALLAVFYTMQSENRKRQNDAYSIKSTTPIGCVEILEYIQDHIEYFYFEDNSKPIPPTDAMQKIAELIQFSKGNVQANLYKMCCQYQVIQSRLSEKENTISDNRARKSLDLLIFAHYIYALLSYTRGGSNRQENPKEFMDPITLTPDKLSKTYKNIVGLIKYNSKEYSDLMDFILKLKQQELDNYSDYDFSFKKNINKL